MAQAHPNYSVPGKADAVLSGAGLGGGQRSAHLAQGASACTGSSGAPMALTDTMEGMGELRCPRGTAWHRGGDGGAPRVSQGAEVIRH